MHCTTWPLQILQGDPMYQPDQVLPFLLLSQHKQLQQSLLGERQGFCTVTDENTAVRSLSLSLSHFTFRFTGCCVLKSSLSSSSSSCSHRAACSALHGLLTWGLNKQMKGPDCVTSVNTCSLSVINCDSPRLPGLPGSQESTIRHFFPLCFKGC